MVLNHTVQHHYLGKFEGAFAWLWKRGPSKQLHAKDFLLSGESKCGGNIPLHGGMLSNWKVEAETAFQIHWQKHRQLPQPPFRNMNPSTLSLLFKDQSVTPLSQVTPPFFGVSSYYHPKTWHYEKEISQNLCSV